MTASSKIADFGVAHIFEEEPEAAPASSDAAASSPAGPASKKKGCRVIDRRHGTRSWSETLKGKEYCAYAGRYWALGITIHALALGTIPYYHPDVMELFPR
ncbi:hypothetical protein PINS_up016009 [Pythium insidiosum]|nr:hypothetical protein PINS_up016009 [Pythium insidiosum]